MGILRADRITGLGGANAITGSTFFTADHDGTAWIRYIDAGISDDFNFGTGDFTLECWINRSTLTNDDAIFATTAAESSSGLFWYFNSSGNLRAYLGDSTERTSSSNNIVVDKWYHVALTRASGTVNIWVDGVSKFSASVTGNVGSSTQNFIIGDGNTGYNGNAYMFLGHISNLRIQKGKAEYTAAFTPPTTRLAVTPETVLLACHDAGNVLAEATGKKLTLVLSGATGSNSAGIVASRFTPNSLVGFSTSADIGSQYGTTFDGFGSFATSTYMVPPGGTTRERNRGRAVFGGGESPTADNVMEYLNIQSGGRTIDFGDHTSTTPNGDAVASSTRGVFTIHNSPANTNALEFITIANTGNSQDFGDQNTGGISQEAAASNSTRGLFAGGIFPGSQVHDTTEYITIATLGNAIDFGNLIATVTSNTGVADATRALFAGGIGPGSPFPTVNRIEYFTIASTGNATDFGDLTFSARYPASAVTKSP